MKAAVFRQFGGANVLSVEPDWPDPEPADDEVLIRVSIVSVNRTLDLAVREGRYAKPVSLPHIPGVDPVGTIVELGKSVQDRKPGDRVAVIPWHNAPDGARMSLGIQRWGGSAEMVAVPARGTVFLPPELDDVTANYVIRHVPQAIHLLDAAALPPEAPVLVMGAAGGLGSAIIQVAKARGLTVIAAAGHPSRVEFTRSLGADVGIDYRAGDLEKETLAATEGAGVPCVIDNVGDADLFPRALRTLARGGCLVTAGAHADGIVPLDLRLVYLNRLSIMGRVGAGPSETREAIEMSLRHRFKAPVAAIYPLDEVREAHIKAADRTTLGKVLIAPFGVPTCPGEAK